MGLRDCTIEEFRVPGENDVRSISYAGMSALEINWPSTRAKYHEFLNQTTLTRDIDFIVDDSDVIINDIEHRIITNKSP